MRDDLIGELLHHLQGRQDWKLGHCPKMVSTTIQTLGLPADLARLLSWRWVNQKRVYVGKYLLRTASEIASDPWLLVLRAYAMVPIGTAANGDVLVLRLAKNQAIEVGVVSRDLFYRDPNGFLAARGYARVSKSFDAFLLRLADGLFVPSDFESARQWNELQRERSVYGALAS